MLPGRGCRRCGSASHTARFGTSVLFPFVFERAINLLKLIATPICHCLCCFEAVRKGRVSIPFLPFVVHRRSGALMSSDMIS